MYITREDASRETAFRCGKEGAVNVFYWVDTYFGVALSSVENKLQILRVAQTVYGEPEASRQLQLAESAAVGITRDTRGVRRVSHKLKRAS